MVKELRRVRVTSKLDLVRLLEEVHQDGIPRLVERNGEPLAVVISPADYSATAEVATSRRRKEALLSLAGVWSDLDAEQMIEALYRARHEAPPSTPIKL
jgi:PHD/YefM family antitoxin component YafN of YafNO toxin-antitoxin module